MLYKIQIAGLLVAILPFQLFAGSERLQLLELIRERNKTAYLSGWVQGDAAWYNNVPAGLMDDGTELRRGVLNLQAMVYNNIGYKLQVDIANAGRSGVKDIYYAYSMSDTLNFRLGNTRDPFMLQDQTSSRNTLFIERALPEAFTAGRHIGLVADYYKQDWTVSAGLLGPAVNTTEDTERDKDWGASARATFSAINKRNKLVHLGLSANYRDTHTLKSIRYNQQPETYIAKVNFVDTGKIEQSQNTQKLGMEIASINGPWSLQAEYIISSVARSSNALRFKGWYAQAGYFFTGESQAFEQGLFTAVTPNTAVGNGGIGAWQLGLRLSGIDLNDRDINGGEMNNLTIGLNWYPTDDIRISANYVNVLKVDGGPQDGVEPDIFQIRFQWEFDYPLRNIVDKISGH
ncbi:MAG: porin [Gammaproteobacteria bacterium]|nr:MAG: porin [Gammaproteobacteria bacterium]